MNKTVLFLSLLVVGASLGACSTVDGVGQDLSKASRAIEGSM